MSTDPLPLSDILAGLPAEADYDAVYAEVAATSRGRWFLDAYAERNRLAHTHMLVGAIARVEAAVRGDPLPQISAALAGEFSDLAALIGRVEAEVAAHGRLANDGLSAAERIQDVAFALREREVDAALCDALEAAIGELGGTFTRNEVAVERARNAAALLRELKGRIDALVAYAVGGTGAKPAAGELTVAGVATRSDAALSDAGDDDAAVEDAVVADEVLMERSAAAAREDENFAALIGALAASFPAPDDDGEPAREPQGESAEAVPPPDPGNTVEPPMGPLDSTVPDGADPEVDAAIARPEPAASASDEASSDEASSAETLSIETISIETPENESAANENPSIETTSMAVWSATPLEHVPTENERIEPADDDTERVAEQIAAAYLTAEYLDVEPSPAASLPAEPFVAEPSPEEPLAIEPVVADTVAADAAAADIVAADTVAADTVAADTVAADTVAADTVAADTVAVSVAETAAEPLAGRPSTVDDAQDAIVAATLDPTEPLVIADTAPPSETTSEPAIATVEITSRQAELPLGDLSGDGGSLGKLTNEILADEIFVKRDALVDTLLRQLTSSQPAPGQDLPNESSSNDEDMSRAPLPSEAFGEDGASDQSRREDPPFEPSSGIEASRQQGSTEDPSSEQSPKIVSSREEKFFGSDMNERLDRLSQLHAEQHDSARDHPLGNDAGGDRAAAVVQDCAAEHDTDELQNDIVEEFATETIVAPAAEESVVPSALGSGSRDSTLPDSQASIGPDEDPDELFEPVPLLLPIPSPLSPVAAASAPTPIDPVAALDDIRPRAPIGLDSAAHDELRAADADTLAIIALSHARIEERLDEAAAARISAAAAADEVFSVESRRETAAPPPPPPVRLPLEQPLPQPRAAATPMARSAARPTPSDPLDTIRALSEAELVALFS
jgi:hypothetical protein